jgi:hypothetical protein
MTDTADTQQAGEQAGEQPGEQTGEQQGEISAGLYVVGQNVELAQIPSDAEDEPTGTEETA